jgi:hypothetical protein
MDGLMRIAPNAPRILSEKKPGDLPTAFSTIIHTGDAERASDDLVRWRGGGWSGALLGGPDLAQPWFIGRSGAYAAVVRAVACTPATASPVEESAELALQAGAARGATESILAALARDIETHGQPSRGGVANALAAQPTIGASAWLIVTDGEWVLEETSARP